jgi:hypothetical protein
MLEPVVGAGDGEVVVVVDGAPWATGDPAIVTAIAPAIKTPRNIVQTPYWRSGVAC